LFLKALVREIYGTATDLWCLSTRQRPNGNKIMVFLAACYLIAGNRIMVTASQDSVSATNLWCFVFEVGSVVYFLSRNNQHTFQGNIFMVVYPIFVAGSGSGSSFLPKFCCQKIRRHHSSVAQNPIFVA